MQRPTFGSRLGFPFFPGFQLSGKQEIFPEIPVKFSELDCLAAGGVSDKDDFSQLHHF